MPESMPTGECSRDGRATWLPDAPTLWSAARRDRATGAGATLPRSWTSPSRGRTEVSVSMPTYKNRTDNCKDHGSGALDSQG